MSVCVFMSNEHVHMCSFKTVANAIFFMNESELIWSHFDPP